MRTTIAERITPVGTTDVHASRLCTSMLHVASTSAMTLPIACHQTGGCARTKRLPRKSIKPVIAASQPMITPTVTSQAEKSAHIISPVRQYVMSVSNAPTKHTIGNGTSMGWIGCAPIRAVEEGISHLQRSSYKQCERSEVPSKSQSENRRFSATCTWRELKYAPSNQIGSSELD